MNRYILIILTGLVLYDILSGDFLSLSALDIVKIAIYAICYAVLLKSGRGDE
jgi:hypothetical protein